MRGGFSAGLYQLLNPFPVCVLQRAGWVRVGAAVVCHSNSKLRSQRTLRTATPDLGCLRHCVPKSKRLGLHTCRKGSASSRRLGLVASPAKKCSLLCLPTLSIGKH